MNPKNDNRLLKIRNNFNDNFFFLNTSKTVKFVYQLNESKRPN